MMFHARRARAMLGAAAMASLIALGGTAAMAQPDPTLLGDETGPLAAGTYLLNDQIVIEDSLFFTGEGKDVTLLDGQDDTAVLKVRTVELLVCDSGNFSF